jgi:hypothetical protein
MSGGKEMLNGSIIGENIMLALGRGFPKREGWYGVDCSLRSL